MFRFRNVWPLITLFVCVFQVDLAPIKGSEADDPSIIDALAAGETKIQYHRDVLPILSDHCFHCHGVDSASRQGGLRLDQWEHANEGGDSGQPAIVAGDLQTSELITRISGVDEDLVMPPPQANDPLSPKQIDTLKRWVERGAEYQPHWGFQPPRQPSLPTSDDTPDRHPIDAWVRHQLDLLEMQPADPAPDHVICRRLYLDLIGIPPTPEEVASFRREGFSATVEKLLNSPRYGEKWARHWLDVARYSDTNGYEKDLRREQWIWRDWVIEALNADMPYDQFVIQQIAGDLLPDATQAEIIATGMLRNSMINEEGAIVPEEFRMAEMFDRLDCVGKAVLGLTTQCAQCHTHKFDPLTHTEYFGMFAFLNNAYEAQSWVYRPEQLRKIEQIKGAISATYRQVQQQQPQWQAAVQQWQQEVVAGLPNWQTVRMHDLGAVSGLNHPVALKDDSILMLGHTSADVYFIGQPHLQGKTGLRLEVLTHGDLPFDGPGRNGVGTWEIFELEVSIRPPDADWQKLTLVQPTADWSEPERVREEGKKKSGPVAFLTDGDRTTGWTADRGVGRRNQPSVAVVQFEQPVDCPEGTEIKVALHMGAMVGRCRISLTDSPTPGSPPIDYAVQQRLQRSPQQWNQQDWDQVFAAWLRTQADFAEAVAAIDEQWAAFPAGWTSVLHLREREPENARPTHLLDRGEWNQPLERVSPHTPEMLHSFAPQQSSADGGNDSESEPVRLQFARWLVRADSPLAARVAVNRVWQAIFGSGLVATPEDFGTRAPVPEHLELLDWLAVDFMQNGWSQKRLIQQIVTSATYQQDSRMTPERLAEDPDNRLLARGPRFRADAEVVRDIALAASGLLSLEMGGPGVIPPVPQNVLDYNYTYPSYWKPTEGPQRYRRTVYGFRKRSMPDPATSNFDAPNGDMACVQRVRSNTPLAALTGLNETIFVEAARALAIRILREAGPDDAQRTKHGFLLCTSREPDLQEQAALLEFLTQQRQRLSDGWLNPREVATGNPEQIPELPEGATPQDAAALTLLSRVLLNLDETLTKN